MKYVPRLISANENQNLLSAVLICVFLSTSSTGGASEDSVKTPPSPKRIEIPAYCEPLIARLAENRGKKISAVIESNRFQVMRGLKKHEDFFGPPFSRMLARLGKGDILVDVGAGTASALLDYEDEIKFGRYVKNPEDRPEVVSIIASLPTKEHYTPLPGISQTDFNRAINRLSIAMTELSPNDFRVLHGRLLEDIPIEEIAKPGTVAGLIDKVGACAYTENLTEDLSKEISLLKEGGEGFLDFHNFTQIYPYLEEGFDLQTVLGARNPVQDRKMSIPQFLSHVQGIKVIDADQFGRVYFIKTSEIVKVPLLRLRYIDDETPPPTRIFTFDPPLK